MSYIFFGTPTFAAAILRTLLDAGFTPLAVVCNPDRPAGRKKTLTPPAVKTLISGGGKDISILQPEKLGSDFEEELKRLKADFYVVSSYAKIIPRRVLLLPRLGTIGVHPSLLPKYRGSSPIQSAILAGETETGVTLYLMDDKLDHGPTIAKRNVSIAPADTYVTLHNKLAEAAGQLLVKTFPRFAAEEIEPQPQNEEEATATQKFTSGDSFVSEKDLKNAESGMHPEEAVLVLRKIRALNPEPGAWTLRDGKRVKLLGAVMDDKRTLKLTRVQKEGKKPVDRI